MICVKILPQEKKTFLAASLSSMNIFSSVLKAEPFKY
jgi:hypothetical protein